MLPRTLHVHSQLSSFFFSLKPNTFSFYYHNMAVSQLSHFIKICIDILYTIGLSRNSDFSRCDYRAAQMKHTIVYESARTDDYLIAAIKKLQHIPFLRRHNCRLTTAFSNQTHRNKWVHAHGRLSPPYLCLKPTPSNAIFLR